MFLFTAVKERGQHFLLFNRLVEFGDLGIELPPLPYDLHPKAGQRKFPAAKDDDEEEEEIEEEEEENVVDNQSHPVQIQPFGSYKKEIEAVVIEAEQGASDNGAVGALAGPPIFRKPQIDSNIYNYNTNYNLVKFDRIFILHLDDIFICSLQIYQYPRELQYDNSPRANPVLSCHQNWF